MRTRELERRLERDDAIYKSTEHEVDSNNNCFKSHKLVQSRQVPSQES